MDRRATLGSRRPVILRIVGVAASVVVAALTVAYLILPLTGRALTAIVAMISSASVWIAVSISTGVSVWGVLGVVGRTASAAIVTPGASASLGVLVLVAAAAAYGLQRLLSEEESSHDR
jgi:hypothetical protein